MYLETLQTILNIKLITEVEGNFIWIYFRNLKCRLMCLVIVTKMIMVTKLILHCLYKNYIREQSILSLTSRKTLT